MSKILSNLASFSWNKVITKSKSNQSTFFKLHISDADETTIYWCHNLSLFTLQWFYYTNYISLTHIRKLLWCSGACWHLSTGGLEFNSLSDISGLGYWSLYNKNVGIGKLKLRRFFLFIRLRLEAVPEISVRMNRRVRVLAICYLSF